MKDGVRAPAKQGRRTRVKVGVDRVATGGKRNMSGAPQVDTTGVVTNACLQPLLLLVGGNRILQ